MSSASSSWNEVLDSIVASRNAAQSSPFREIVAANFRLRVSAAASMAAVARIRALEAEKTAMEATISELQQASKGIQLKSARELELEKKCADLTQKLQDALMQQSEYFKMRYEKQAQDTLVAQMKQRINELESSVESMVSQGKEREEAYALIRNENSGFRSENELQRKKMIRLEEEHSRFLKEILASKAREADLQDEKRKLEEEILAFRKSGTTVQSPAHESPTELRFSMSLASGAALGGNIVPAQVVRSVDDAHNAECYCVAVTENGRSVWTGGNDRVLRCWDSSLMTAGQSIPISAAPLCMDSVAERLVVGGPDGNCRVWDLTTSRSVCQLTGHQDKILAVYFAPTQHHVVSASADRTIRLWDVGHAAPSGSIICPSTCHDLSVIEDRICTGHFDGVIRVWDPRTRGQPVMEVKSVHDNRSITSVRWSTDRNRIVSMGRDNAVRVTDARTWQCTTAMTSDKLSLSSNMMRLGMSPDGNYAACGSAAGALFIWSLSNPSATGPLKVIPDQHKGLLSHALWFPDGRSMVTIGQDRRVNLWR